MTAAVQLTSTARIVPIGRPAPANFANGPANYAPALGSTEKFRITGSASNLLKAKFDRLAAAWRTATAFSSTTTEIILDPNYQQIIGMGVAVVPLILQELRNDPDHWYWALAAITGANPTKNVPEGDLQATCDAWLDWGKRRGIVR